MSIRDPRTGTKLPPPVCQEVFEIVMDTQQWVRQAAHSGNEMACSSVLLIGGDEDAKHGYAGAVAQALGVEVHRLPVLQCLGRADAMRKAFANVAAWGGVVIFEGLHLLSDARYGALRDDVVELLESQTMGDRPLVIVGTGRDGVEDDFELASCFGRVGVLSHRGLAKVHVAPARSLAMA